MKAKKLPPKTRTRALALGGCILLLLLLLMGRALGGRAWLTAEKAPTREDRIELLRSLGWEADPASEEVQTVHIPESFPPVYEDYNTLQREQGFDLQRYAGRDCELYTYAVTNWPDESQTVLANLYLYKGRVIAGDVHSTNLNGFMIGIR